MGRKKLSFYESIGRKQHKRELGGPNLRRDRTAHEKLAVLVAVDVEAELLHPVGPARFFPAAVGPAVQDLWMFLSGEREEMALQMKDLLDGYREFAPFPMAQLQLIEALRTLRMLYHAAWLARRWADPAFPRAFPWFGEPRYWEELVLGLREQLARMQEPALELPWD